MVSTVERGTGTATRINGVAVAGKTGTAENIHGAPHGWFVGFAPASEPRIAVAVIVENGGSGGTVAAPIARQLILEALR
jgi:peptidoglycan glycosyltransferase